MKRNLLMMIMMMHFFACKENPLPPDEKFFNSNKLPLLSLEEVNHFWRDDSVQNISNFIDGSFNDHSGFLGGVSYWGKNKGIAVSVFKSRADAIEAMELRRHNVAAVIELGNSSEMIKGKWWFGENNPNIVFVNQWNTIIEVL